MRIGIMGVTGVGKSTLARTLAYNLKYTYSAEPIPNTLTPYLNSIGTAFSHRYLLTHQMAVLDANERLVPERFQNDVVVDRPIGESIFAFSKFKQDDIYTKSCLDVARVTPLDIAYVLIAHPDIIRERITARNRPGEYVAYTKEWIQKHVDDYIWFYDMMAACHDCKQAKLITTDNKSADEVFSEVYKDVLCKIKPS